MRLPRDWPLLVLAAVALALAIYAGKNVTVAVAAGLLATLAVALLFVEPLRNRARPRAAAHAPPVPAVPVSLIESFRAGPSGREEIVHVLDRIERAGPQPDLAIATPQEIARVRALSRAEFRAYVEARVTTIEKEAW